MQELHDSGRLHYTKSGSVEYIRYLDEMPGREKYRWSSVDDEYDWLDEVLGFSGDHSMIIRLMVGSNYEVNF